MRIGLPSLRDFGLRRPVDRDGDDAPARHAVLVRAYEEGSVGWFWQTDRTGRVVYLSAKVAQEIVPPGTTPVLTDLFAVDSDRPDTERTLGFHLSSRTSFMDYSVRAVGGGADRWWSISGRPLVDDVGNFQGFVGWGNDLSERRRAEAEIQRLALFDSLTGLANRQRMTLSLGQALAQTRTSNRAVSLFLLDLDRFKAVNDTLGHPTGDELLKQVAGRLLRTVGDAGLVGRLGGDEFQVILPGSYQRDPLATLATRIISALSQPYDVAGARIAIGCSVGIAIAPDNGDEGETLVRNADLALYAAKADGRGIHRFYRDEMLEGARTRRALEDDLRQALAAGQFAVHYQPVVATSDARIVGYEALLRWEHPARGAVSPQEFIPIAEECGLIEEIGAWVLRTACRDAAGWPDGVRVAVNVSPIQFANPGLPAIVAGAIAASGIVPARLELEITESVFLNEDASSDAMFAALRGLGVRFALDDFGTGYSSLGYLRKAPFDKIKIDQSFVRGAADPGNRNAAIIRAIVSLADALGMETTAEGVETQDEIALIRDLGCSHIQGWVYGRPVPPSAIGAYHSEPVVPVGHRVSRAPRAKMLRWATLEIGGTKREVRIRNMSDMGAMVDGIAWPGDAVGMPVRLDLGDRRPIPAQVRWGGDGRMGLAFANPVGAERPRRG